MEPRAFEGTKDTKTDVELSASPGEAARKERERTTVIFWGDEILSFRDILDVLSPQTRWLPVSSLRGIPPIYLSHPCSVPDRNLRFLSVFLSIKKGRGGSEFFPAVPPVCLRVYSVLFYSIFFPLCGCIF